MSEPVFKKIIILKLFEDECLSFPSNSIRTLVITKDSIESQIYHSYEKNVNISSTKITKHRKDLASNIFGKMTNRKD